MLVRQVLGRQIHVLALGAAHLLAHLSHEVDLFLPFGALARAGGSHPVEVHPPGRLFEMLPVDEPIRLIQVGVIILFAFGAVFVIPTFQEVKPARLRPARGQTGRAVRLTLLLVEGSALGQDHELGHCLDLGQ